MAYYVDFTNGSDSSVDPTSEVTPWKTINKALQATPAGQTCYVKGNQQRYNISVSSQSVSRVSPMILAPYAGHRPIIMASTISNIKQVTMTGGTGKDWQVSQGMVFRDGCDHWTFQNLRSVQVDAAANNRYGTFAFQGPGSDFAFEDCLWQSLTWTPPTSTSQNGPVAINVNVDQTAFTGAVDNFTVRRCTFKDLIGFDAMQFAIYRNVFTPDETDWHDDFLIEDNVMDNVTEGSTLAHSDPFQMSGYYRNPIVRRNFCCNGTRGLLFQPSANAISGGAGTAYYGRITGLLLENNVVVNEGINATDFGCFLYARMTDPVVRHNTFYNATPDATKAKRGLIIGSTAPGDDLTTTTGVVLENNILSQIELRGTVGFASKGHNVIKANYQSRYTPAATDTMNTQAVFQDAANTIQPRQLEDFLLNGAQAARNGADLTAAFTVSVDARGFARTGSKDIGALDVDAGSGAITDTTPPTVTITSPVAGPVSGTVQIGAAASDNVGVVGVQFKVDDVDQGAEALTAPYTVAWDTTGLDAGSSHTVTAVARDAAGNTTTSAAVTVTIADTLAPTVAVTSPTHASTIPAGATSLAATASDNVGVAGVQFTVDGVNVGAEDTSSPFTGSWDASGAAAGSQHTIRAVARDAAGNATTSQGVVVTIAGGSPDPVPDPPPPSVAPDTGVWGIRL